MKIDDAILWLEINTELIEEDLQSTTEDNIKEALARSLAVNRMSLKSLRLIQAELEEAKSIDEYYTVAIFHKMIEMIEKEGQINGLVESV